METNQTDQFEFKIVYTIINFIDYNCLNVLYGNLNNEMILST